MNKKIIGVLFLMISVMVALSGCGEGPTPPPSVDLEAVKSGITTALSQFTAGVEEYDVTKMLANFSDGTDFKLTIAEGDWSYDKDYATLNQELTEDAAAQQAWRAPVAEDGHNYQLTLTYLTTTFSNLSASGGIIMRDFEVRESAAGIPETKTDQGTITCQLAKQAGAWKVVAMTIEFQALTGAGFQSKNYTFSNNHGFGFGMKSW